MGRTFLATVSNFCKDICKKMPQPSSTQTDGPTRMTPQTPIKTMLKRFMPKTPTQSDFRPITQKNGDVQGLFLGSSMP